MSPPAPTLRLAGPADAAAVTALLAACYPRLMASAYPPAVLAVALPLMTRANPALLASGSYYLAEGADGALLGCGGWTPDRPGRGDVRPGLAHIRHFATHPTATGQGIGRALFTRCLADATAAGFDRFECYASLNAVGFYAALGFIEAERTAVAMGDGIAFPCVLMRWPA